MVLKKHIYINDIEMRELVNNNDLRFFKHQKYLLNKMLDTNNGFYVKHFTWDSNILLNDFELCNKIKHINVIKPLCYFEFEDDIIDYLENTNLRQYEELAVIISEYYDPVKENIKNKVILLQIILLFHHIFFNFKICFKDINIDNIYFQNLDKPKNVKYNFLNQSFRIQTQNIVIFDDFYNSFKTDDQQYFNEFMDKIMKKYTDFRNHSDNIDCIDKLNQIILFLR